MTAQPLAPWPEKPCAAIKDTAFEHLAACLDYERARADAWEARCRMAVEALKEIVAGDQPTEHPTEYGGCWAPVAKEALKQIGKLPPAGAGG